MVFSVYDDNIFRFFHEFNLSSIRELKVFFQILNITKNVYFSLMWSHVTKHISKAGKVDRVKG